MDVPSAVERAVAALEPGGHLVEAIELTGGVSADVVRLDLATSTGATRRVVFRRHRSDRGKPRAQRLAAKEHGLLAALHRSGFAVPEPYLYDADGDGVPYLVTEWIDGSTDVCDDDLPGALEQMARFLVDLHALDPGTSGLPALEQIEDPRTAVIPYLPSTEAGARARAALASVEPEQPRDRSVLLHGDYWPGNVMWRDGRLAAVIDWEDACLGDRLADLATARVELLCRYGAEAMDRFTDRYLTMAQETSGVVRTESLVVWELYVSASALAVMGDWGLDPADEARRRHLTEQFFARAARRLARPPDR